VRGLRSHPDTSIPDMWGNLTRQLVKQVRELFSPPKSGIGVQRGTFRSRDKVSTWAWRNWVINDVGNGLERAPLSWLWWSGSQCDLVSDTSLRVVNLLWHSIGWSPTKSMTQLITHVDEGYWGASIIVWTIDVPTTDSYDTRMSEVISRNEWPDCYQENNA